MFESLSWSVRVSPVLKLSQKIIRYPELSRVYLRVDTMIKRNNLRNNSDIRPNTSIYSGMLHWTQEEGSDPEEVPADPHQEEGPGGR